MFIVYLAGLLGVSHENGAVGKLSLLSTSCQKMARFYDAGVRGHAPTFGGRAGKSKFSTISVTCGHLYHGKTWEWCQMMRSRDNLTYHEESKRWDTVVQRATENTEPR